MVGWQTYVSRLRSHRRDAEVQGGDGGGGIDEGSDFSLVLTASEAARRKRSASPKRSFKIEGKDMTSALRKVSRLSV